MQLYLFKGSTTVLQVKDAFGYDDAPLAAGSGQITLKDEEGNLIAGQAWPAALMQIGVTNDYEVLLSAECEVELGQMVQAIVEFDGGPDRVYYDEPTLKVRTPSNSCG